MCPGLGHPEVGADHDERADGDVDEEDPRPRERRRDPAARQGAHRGGAGDDGAPHPERRGPVLAAERRVHGRQRRGQDRGRAEALGEPPDDERAAVVGRGGEQRPGEEDDDARHEEPSSPEPVAETARREQQRGQHDGVRGADPLRLAQPEVQVGDDVRDGDCDDRPVDDDHRQRDRQDDERAPPVGVGPRVDRGFVVLGRFGLRRVPLHGLHGASLVS
ncbi:Uncharacterised protein [Mycobacteroides abscessus]|nr:Uncharacterised protein [Mycobacteroides abscessus]